MATEYKLYEMKIAGEDEPIYCAFGEDINVLIHLNTVKSCEHFLEVTLVDEKCDKKEIEMWVNPENVIYIREVEHPELISLRSEFDV